MKLPIPNDRPRPAYRLNHSTTAASPGLQGSATEQSTGGAVLSGTTYRELVAVPNATNVRVRLLTATATGTLNVKPVAPVAATSTDESVMDKTGFIDPLKVMAYATGTGTAAVSAGVEQKVDLALFGENYILVEFVCTLNGTLTWCDVCQLVYT